MVMYFQNGGIKLEKEENFAIVVLALFLTILWWLIKTILGISEKRGR